MNNNVNGIKSIREKKNLSQLELANRLGIEVSVMKGMEVGAKFPSLENLKKLCYILDTTADILLSGDNRASLNLSGLRKPQVEIIRDLYTKIKEDYDGGK